MTDLYTALLDAGDRLADALETGDLGGAASALGERSALLAALREGEHAAPAADLAGRFRVQDQRLNGLLHRSLTAAGAAVGAAGQATSAHRRYRTAGRPPSVLLDTAPRAAGEISRGA